MQVVVGISVQNARWNITATCRFLHASWIQNRNCEVAASGTERLHDESRWIAGSVSNWLQPYEHQSETAHASYSIKIMHFYWVAKRVSYYPCLFH